MPSSLVPTGVPRQLITTVSVHREGGGQGHLFIVYVRRITALFHI